MSLNLTILTGNLGSEPRYLTFPSTGRMKVSFSIATSRIVKTADGRRTEETEWTPVVAWGRLGERVEKVLAKGVFVLVQGQKRTRTYADRQGVDHTIVELVAEDIRTLTQQIGA
jgi:single-strand DNA-binding protein